MAIASRERKILSRLTSVALTVGLAALPALFGVLGRHTTALPEPATTLLDLHPVETALAPPAPSTIAAMPQVIRRGVASPSDPRQIQIPGVVMPSQPATADPGSATGQAGTGFFVGGDGTLLTAAHVVKSCTRTQIISRYVARTWVSVLAADEANDIAILRAPDLRPPAIVRVAAAPPVSDKLFVLGYPASASLTVAMETWGVVENQKFPAGVGALANPRELLWMSAPAVTHGYSGGPIFDPKLGAVVGIVKGEVDGGYLRLVHDMPTTGMAIGPGIARLTELVRHEVPYSEINLAALPGEAGEDALRRATVHVLCWH